MPKMKTATGKKQDAQTKHTVSDSSPIRCSAAFYSAVYGVYYAHAFKLVLFGATPTAIGGIGQCCASSLFTKDSSMFSSHRLKLTSSCS
jgi:hypothetical protein